LLIREGALSSGEALEFLDMLSVAKDPLLERGKLKSSSKNGASASSYLSLFYLVLDILEMT
jgi:hypothetical protein